MKEISFSHFALLRSQHACDSRAETLLRRHLARGKKVLIVGEEGAGKDSVAETLYHFLHDEEREAVLLPTFTVSTLEEAHQAPRYRQCRLFLQASYTVLQPLGYRKDYGLDPQLPNLPKLAEGFGLVVDMRRLPDGTRLIAQLFTVTSQGLHCVYRAPLFAALQIGLAA